MDEALLCISLAGRGQLAEMLITLEPHGIFGSHFAYLFVSPWRVNLIGVFLHDDTSH